MSEESTLGITLAEKFFGLLLVIIGVLTTYITVTSTDALGAFAGFFGFLSLILLALGLFLIITKTES